MSSPAPFDEAAEAQRKAEKKARKAEKKRRREEEAEAESATAPAAAAAEESPSGSPVAPGELEEDAERQARKRRKQEKKERKAREAEAGGEGAAPMAVEVSPSPSPVMGERASTMSASPLTAQRKNFYQQHPEVRGMSRAAVDAIRAEYKMTLTGEMYGQESLYHPVTGFHQCGYSKELLRCTQGFKAPTGIQAQAWPVLLMGRDAIAIAETGSGKTLGFVLPALVHILDAKPIDTQKRGGKGGVENMGPVALILAPTRELAMQSAEVAESAAKNVGLTVACVYGGVERYVQRQAIAKGVHIMVACPGRLLSFVKDGEISLSRVSFLVLDEADRMLDMGFEPDIRAIIGYCPDSQRRQTLMFSATWPESVKALAAAFIVDPLRITIGKDESELSQDTLAANKRITQTVEVMDEWKRDARLIEIMQQATKGAKEHKKIIVFVLYKKEVDRVERTLRAKGFNAVGMSSDKSQAERTAAIENFKNGKVRLLVATDVAGRGLDINDIALVLNYSFPLTVEDYVHRIGRTGRGGKSGESITFFTKNEKHLSGELINVLREANQEVPEALMKFGTGVKRKEHGMYGAFYKAQDDDKPMKKATKVTFD